MFRLPGATQNGRKTPWNFQAWSLWEHGSYRVRVTLPLKHGTASPTTIPSSNQGAPILHPGTRQKNTDLHRPTPAPGKAVKHMLQ